MIPSLVSIGGPWKVLPPGEHKATMKEIKIRYATTACRKHLYRGLQEGVNALRYAGCCSILLDGSFVTEKPNPGDYDVCWDPIGVDDTMLDPVFFDFDNNRKNQKDRYHGEFFPANALADKTTFFPDFFQRDKYTGKLKGIIRISLRKLKT